MFEFEWGSSFGVATIGWIVFSVCFILYCCSDPSAPGPLGLMTGLVYLIVELLGRALRRVFGHRLSNAFFLAFHYLFRKSNPVLQVVYLLLVNGGYVLFLLYGQRYYIPLWSLHTPVIVLTMLFNFLSFFLCSISDPGVITRENAAEWNQVFPHDQRMYLARVMCPTCEIEKPARSKHCAFCDRCVMKFDHHCVWVNNCIGLNNYRFFLAFLLQHVWFTLYGSILTGWMMQQIIAEKDLWNVSYRDPTTGKFIPSSAKFVFQYITYYHGVIWGLFMLLSVMFLVLLGFSLYHLFLAGSNTTTNERSKLGWIAQGINVHAHHELYVLNPYYIKIQSQLREANKELVRRAFEEAKRPVPHWPDAQSTAEELAEAKAISAAASAAALAVSNANRTGASTSSSPLGAEVAASASAAPAAAAAAAAPLFPPPPYSPALQQLMLSYQSLKLDVVSTYEKLQTLQNQGFVTPSAAEALQQGQAQLDAPAVAEATALSSSSPELATKQQKAQKAGLSLGAIEATEGCVPVSAAPAVAAAASAATDSGEKKKQKKQRLPNPYSLGVWGNFMQLLYPPKKGQTVPLRNTRSDSSNESSADSRASSKPVAQSKKKR